ncbi:hypothetical protein [Edaphovirga cremea]
MSASSLPQDVLYAAADWYATIFDEHCTDEERQITTRFSWWVDIRAKGK